MMESSSAADTGAKVEKTVPIFGPVNRELLEKYRSPTALSFKSIIQSIIETVPVATANPIQVEVGAGNRGTDFVPKSLPTPLMKSPATAVSLTEASLPDSASHLEGNADAVTDMHVQKRGSVGRTIDVARYRGYDDLRHDLACMFGIEGLLEVSYRTDWELVYVDHENDVLHVGDDPWEEFVNCVKSMMILSAAEVQQLSLDGDLGNTRTQNQACTGPDDGNVWRG